MIGILTKLAPHHKELKNRLISCIVVITITTIIAYLFIEPVATLFMRPLFMADAKITNLVYTNLTEAFISYIKLALLIGIGVSLPFIIYQVWMFVAPGLHKHEKRIAIRIIFWGMLLFMAGAAFSFFVALPRILIFFMSYAGENLEAMPKLGLYLSFIGRTILAFGLAFEVPFLMFMTTKTGLIKREQFQQRRKYFYIIILVASFLLTAGEPTATILLAVPLFALYEAGIIISKVFRAP